MKKKSRPKAKARPAKKAKAEKVLKAKVKPKAKARPKAKKSAAKKPSKSAKKTAAAPSKSTIIAPVNSILLGTVEDYFAKIGVIALTLLAPVALGQRIQVLGHTTNLEFAVDSMQIDHAAVTSADKNSGVGIKVGGRARAGDHVYLLK